MRSLGAGCVDTTCRRAFSLGFEVVLISDAHSTWDSAVLPADRIIQHTNHTLAEWFVRLAPSEDASFATALPLSHR